MDLTTSAWLGLTDAGDEALDFVLTPPLARFDGKLFGGTGLAIAVATVEAVTGRAALWVTVQFVGSADVGEHLHIQVEELAAGRRTSQVRLTATVDDRLVLAALGSTSERNLDGFAAVLDAMPVVSDPEDSTPFEVNLPFDLPEVVEIGPFATAEFREAKSPDATQRVWGRLREHHQTRASLGYLADFVPAAVVRAAGRKGGGRSLDNSIRFGPDVPAGLDWVLIDNEPYLAENGYVHGAARIWTPEGQLLAVASQSAVAMLFPEDET
jgi:acyl-CoA thioesterase